MTTETTAALDEERMGAFVGQVLGELGFDRAAIVRLRATGAIPATPRAEAA